MRCFKSIYTAPVAAIIVIRKLRRGTIAPIGRHNARVGYPQVDGQYLLRQRRIHNLNRIGFAIYLDSGFAAGYALNGYLCFGLTFGCHAAACCHAGKRTVRIAAPLYFGKLPPISLSYCNFNPYIAHISYRII